MRYFKFTAFLFFVIISISSCRKDKKVITQTEVSFTKEGELTIVKSTSDSTIVTLDIEMAKTDYEIQTGLMYRNSMKNNQGMLFVFEGVRERSFYMKNTRIPLDLIFINENKTIVSFQKNAKPMDESSLLSNAPAKYVLEVNAGMVDVWAIGIGDTVSYTE